MQKFIGSTFSLRQYTVPLSHLFRASPPLQPEVYLPVANMSDSESNADGDQVANMNTDDNVSEVNDETGFRSTRPQRERRKPAWLQTGEWER